MNIHWMDNIGCWSEIQDNKHCIALCWGEICLIKTTKLSKPKQHLDDIWMVLYIAFSF